MSSAENMTLWVVQFRKSLAELDAQDFGYPLRNRVLAPSPSRPALPRPLESLYAVCDGLSLPHVHNAYFIESAEGVAAMPVRGEPGRVEGPLSPMEIVVFGRDGGGARFVLRTDGGSVYYLPSGGAMRNRVYESEPGWAVPERLADSVSDFLWRLKVDVDAFVRDDRTHKYMAR